MSKLKNSQVAKVLYQIADLLELKNEQFKPMAYRRAAQNIELLAEDIEEVFKQGKLREISGVGEGISARIQEYLTTGTLTYLEELKKEIPEDLNELLKIEGIGPKTAIKLYKELGIKNVADLELAIKSSKLKNISGFGDKKADEFLKGIAFYKSVQGKFLLSEILPIAKEIKKQLIALEGITKVKLVGSIRRKADTIGDIDILVVSAQPMKVIKAFNRLSPVSQVLSKGETKSSVVLSNKIQVDLRVIDDTSFGSAMQYFTGSKEHNIKLREIAKNKKMKLNEYGLFHLLDNIKIAGSEEKEIYTNLDLTYIEPELRENRGEIELALRGQLPLTIQHSDLKGDLHMHTTWSDGSNSIEEMAEACKILGYEYLAICDHSAGLKVAGGLNDREIRNQIHEISKVNKKNKDIYILSGIELNIDADGKLDIHNDTLKDLDIVIASIHSGFKQEEKKITQRLVNAMHNDYVSIIGHPTGRIINQRAPYQVDLSKIFGIASDLGILLEINAFPDRLDLSDINCFKAKQFNCKFSIGTDAHNTSELQFIEYGVYTARRGWLTANDIINTLSLKELQEIIHF